MATIDFVVKNGLQVNENAAILETTDALNSTDAAASLSVAGGAAIAKKLFVGTDLSASGDLAVNGGDLTTTAATFNLINANATTVNFAGAATALEIGAATGTTNINNNLDVDGDVNIDGGDLTVSTATFNLANTTATTGNLFGAATAVNIGAATGTTNVKNNLDVDGNAVIDLDLEVRGGDLTTNQTTFNLLNTTATTVNFAGAATLVEIGAATGTTNINNNLDVDGDINIDGGDLTVSTTTFNLANTTAETVNFAGAGTAVTIGATTGTTTIRNANTVVTGDLAVNGADITTTATGTATVFNTNATTVNAFGAGTAITIGATTGTTTIRNANTVITGDLAINGGDLTTNQTTFNLLNATATTVNFAGAATTLEIGAATGTTNINNNLDVDGDINIDGGDLTVSTTTFNLANTTATTGNLFGAGTAITIGATTGTTTIRNANTVVTGDLAVNGADITTTATGTATVFNTNATTVNAFGAATAVNIGAATGTTNVKNNLDVDGNAVIDLDLEVRGGDLTTNQTTFNLLNATATTLNIGGAATTVEIGAATGTTNINNNLDVDGDVNIDGGDLTVSTTTFNLANTTATTLNIGGAATAVNIGAATGNTTVNNNLIVTGDLTVNGDVTTVNTSTLDVEDINITIAKGAVNAAAANGAGITVDGANALITYLSAGDEWAFNKTVDITGALDVSGNATVGGTLSITGDTIFTGDLAVNGGDLTTTATTFNLIDANAATVNFARAGTAITIGATTGTTTIRNANTVVTGDLAVNGADITTTATGTATVFNTNATTVNAFGAGTAVTIGATTGTTTIRNANTVVTGDLAVNGADITTTATGTATLFNTNATTVNIAGAGTAVNIGAATGTTNVKNNLDVDGDVNIDGGDLTVSTATFNLANTNASTVNAFGAALTVNMGLAGATGVMTIRNDSVVLDGDLQVKGGDITTNQTTFNLINGTATTVNFAGAGTSVNIGNTTAAQTMSIGSASTGASTYNFGTAPTATATTKVLNIGTGGASGSTTNVNIGSDIGGTTTVNSGTLVGALTTQNVFNTVATTVNAFGAAGTINLGNATGTITVRNPTVVGTETTVNLWNTVSTTVNAFGAATAIEIGAATGTTSINNSLTVDGNVTLGDASGDSVTINASTVNIPNTITLVENDTSNNAVSFPITIAHTTSNPPSAGIGTGIQFITETSNDNNEIGATIESIVTDATLDSEDFDFVIRQMIAGAAAAQTFKLNLNSLQIGANNTNTSLTTQGTSNLTLNTNNGTNSGTITIANGANGNITVEPNGTGDVYLNADTVRVGDSNSAATITTNGTGDLTINTNSGTNSGSIIIANGANGNITLEPNGTGDVYLNADTVRVGDSNADTTILSNGTGSLILSPGTDLIVGNANTSATPVARILRATSGTGTNISAANLQLQGGLSTGSATGGSITFATGTIGASGTAAQAATTRMTVSTSGNNSTLDLATAMTTANVFNTTAATVNVFGAGTAVTIGATTGTTTIRNANTVVTGDLAVNGGDLITNQTTFNLLNTTATTVNAFGAGTAITIGATTGNTTVRNTLNLTNATTALSVKSNLNFVSPDNNNTITVRMLDSDVLSVSGNSGQLFSISDSLVGTIFAVNDISGVPSIEVFDTGKIQLAELFGNVLIGTATDDSVNKLQVNGNAALSGDIAVNGGDITTTATTFNLINTTATTTNAFGASSAINLGVNSAAAGTLTIGPTLTGNTVKINSLAGGTVNVTTDVTTGTANIFTSVTTGTVNLATGGASITNIGGAGSTLNIGTTAGNSVLEIRGNASAGNAVIRTNSVTANVFNVNSTTVNFAGAATAVNIGAVTGTATIRNPTVVGTQATVNLWNATSTTVNAFGAATAINMGAATGTFTVGNPTLTMTNGTGFNMNGANPSIASTNTGTASVFNANITTVNIGQAASISMGSTTGTVTARGNFAVNGNTTLGDASGDTITANANLVSVPNTLTFNINDATANGISYPVKASHTTSGTPVAGIGVGMDFVVETSNDNNEIGARIEAITTDVTATSEDFDMVFKTMVNGATATQSMLVRNNLVTVGANATNTTINTQNSSNLTVTTGAVTTTASGSSVTVAGGAGGTTSGAGGAVTVQGGNATTNGTGGTATLRSGSAVGTNITGSSTTVDAGQGTGTGTSGDIVFRTGLGGDSGTQLNPLTTVLTLKPTGVDIPGDVTINGDLTVNGVTTTVNSSTVTVDDKNLELGAVNSGIVSATGTVGSITGTGPWTATITNMTSTAGLIPGSAITANNSTGSIGGSGTYIVVSVNNRTSITYTATGGTTPSAGSVVNISTTGATNFTADGGGITLKGTTDKTINWLNSITSWQSSEDFSVASGKTFGVNGTAVLSDTNVLQNQTSATIGSTAAAATVNIGANNQNNILNINGNGTGGTATLTTNVTTGTVNAFNSVTGAINIGTGMTAGALTMGGTAQTGSITIGRSTSAQSVNIGTGAQATGVTKTVNIGTGGASGSTTNVTIGSSTAGALGTTTVNGSAVNIATNHNAATTVTVGPAISGNILKVGSITGGTINLTTDVTTGTANMFTSITTGTANIFSGITTGTANIATAGGSITNIGGNGATLNVGGTAGNATLNIRGNGTAGIASLGTNVTTGTINLVTGLTTGTVNFATGGATTTNIGGNGAALNIGTVSGNSTLTVRGNGAAGTATITTNVTTGTVNFMGNLTTGTVNIGSANGGRVAIAFNQASTSTTTGALTVAGGVGITGALNATTKSFIIPHPTKKGMLLKHGSLEGPEFGVYTRGRLKDGTVIQLPDYWAGLVDKKTITVDLTACGKHQRLYVEKIKGLEIHIGNEGSGAIDCFYTVWGERKDVDKLEVEVQE